MAKSKKWLKWMPVMVLVLCCVGLLSYVLYIQSPITPTTTADRSTFTVSAYVDGENVSPLVPISLWTPKASAEFDSTEDLYNIVLNFQETTSSVDAEDISVDLSGHTYVWAQMDPDAETVFLENWRMLLPGGINGEYSLIAYDPSTDLNFNMFDLNLNEVTVADHQTDGNYTLIYDVPHYTTTVAQMHYGTNWDLSADDFADLSQTLKEDYWDEKNWAGQFSTFDPNDFVYKTTLSHPLLSGMTNAFAFKITFNDSVSIVDGSATQVNFTLGDSANFESVVSGDIIYLISYQPLIFKSGIKNLAMEFSYAVNISMSDIDSGNIPILQSGNSLGTFVKLSDIAS